MLVFRDNPFLATWAKLSEILLGDVQVCGNDQNVVELFNDSTRPVEFKREKHVRSFLLATISMTDIFFSVPMLWIFALLLGD